VRLSCALPLSLFSLFSLFFPQFINRLHGVLRRNPGPPAARRSTKQRDWPLFAAVIRCFDAKARIARGATAIASGPDEQ
jgi:hypothetical protein